tara:strand:+ start:475 stop:885 length:411 start_codon:yes stop_codon:yes gene_type:complete
MFFSKSKNKDSDLIKVASLLIHAAKIDENYTIKEEDIIKKALTEIGVKQTDLDDLLNKAKKNEAESVQILDFTKEVKSMDESNKIKIIETLWKIIYSNKEADIFETNLMRRLGGLLYIDNNLMGKIKEKIKKENEQ